MDVYFILLYVFYTLFYNVSNVGPLNFVIIYIYLADFCKPVDSENYVHLRFSN